MTCTRIASSCRWACARSIAVSVVREGMADKIVDEYGNLRELMDDIEQNPNRLGELGVRNPNILTDSLYRMWGKKE